MEEKYYTAPAEQRLAHTLNHAAELRTVGFLNLNKENI
jgi:hypothetical protein